VLCTAAITATAQTPVQEPPSIEYVRASILRDVGDATERDAKSADAPDFFGHGTARITGYVRGYDSESGFTTAQILLENILTRENHPVTVDISPDGWFAADVALEYPKRVSLMIRNKFLSIYLEQGSCCVHLRRLLVAAEAHYDQFVEEQALTNSFLVTKDDMNRFQQLFKFSGMPRYVLLGPDGRVLDDNFNPYVGIKRELEKYK
jgi:hypothetical protein